MADSPDVFRKLQVKISLCMLLVFAIVLAVLIGSLNQYLYKVSKSSADDFIDMLVKNGGCRPNRGPHGERTQTRPDGSSKSMELVTGSEYMQVLEKNPRPDNIHRPEYKREQTVFEKFFPFRAEYIGFQDYFAACLDKHGQIKSVQQEFVGGMDRAALTNIISTVIAQGKERGVCNDFGYALEPTDNGYLLILLDRVNDLSRQRHFYVVSILVFFLCLAISFGLSWVFASIAIAPVKEAFLKQKRFIADASHELKTPIAVIGANIDVLQQELKDNKWLEYIKVENARMKELVLDMLYLAKNDAGRTEYNRLPVDLSDLTACSVLPFESVAFEQGKKLQLEIPKTEIPVLGDEPKLKQVIIILTDNALKNSDSGALIKVTAGIEGRNAFVKVYNSGHGISAEDMHKIFDRFYRSDSSRARATGGYGLGLAIAQSIATGHKGRIDVDSKLGEYAQFTLWLPLNQKK